MLVDLILSLGLAIVFLLSGATKLAGVKKIAAQFERWRYPPSVRIAGGALEVAGAALLLVPNLSLYGALVLLGVLVTALYTHVLREKVPSHGAAAAILLVFVVVLGLLRGDGAAGPAGGVFHALLG